MRTSLLALAFTCLLETDGEGSEQRTYVTVTRRRKTILGIMEDEGTTPLEPRRG